jgi:hypothetical protein
MQHQQASSKPIGLVILIGTILLTLGCQSTPESSAPRTAPPRSGAEQLDDLIVVDCLLPGQIRQLGSRMTYLAPRRRVKTTQSDCGIRGGEFVLFDRSDYRHALQSLLPKARDGDAVAQTYVGEIYEKGLGLSAPDYPEAARWYRQAAKRGHRPAQTNLGSLYERGLGVRQNQAAALEWYRRATGLTEDRLIFESELKAQQAAFQREIALRNRVAASLRAQLTRARAQPATAAVPVEPQKLESIAQSLQRDAASEQEQVRKQLHAVKTLQAADAVEADRDTGKAASGVGKKTALVGKLELTLRQHSEALAANQTRLAMTP